MAGLVVVVLLATGCSRAPSTHPANPRPVTLGSSCGAPSSIHTAVEGGAEPPMCIADQWVFVLPGMPNPPTVRRSELFLTHKGVEVAGGEGAVIDHEVDLTVHLDAAGRGDDDWHVVWQLHGPTSGEWRPPPVSMRIRNGELTVSGGAGWPGHDWKTANHEWSRILTPIEDGRRYRVRVTTHLASDPKQAWISARVDGRTVLEKWHPRSEMGYEVGTLYPGQATVKSRIGLYRGSQGAQPPSYTQAVAQKIVDAKAELRR